MVPLVLQTSSRIRHGNQNVVVDLLYLGVEVLLGLGEDVEVLGRRAAEVLPQLVGRLLLERERAGALAAEPVQGLQVEDWAGLAPLPRPVHALGPLVGAALGQAAAAPWRQLHIGRGIVRLRQRSWQQQKR